MRTCGVLDRPQDALVVALRAERRHEGVYGVGGRHSVGIEACQARQTLWVLRRAQWGWTTRAFPGTGGSATRWGTVHVGRSAGAKQLPEQVLTALGGQVELHARGARLAGVADIVHTDGLNANVAERQREVGGAAAQLDGKGRPLRGGSRRRQRWTTVFWRVCLQAGTA